MSALRDFLLAPPDGAPATAVAGAGRGRVLARRGDAAATTHSDGAALTANATPAAVAVLCAAEDARAIGIATAVFLARRTRSPCALACIWTALAPQRRAEARPPAARGARRLASVLAGRGLDAVACGRATAVALPGDPAEALPAAVRAAAAAGPAPVAIVLGGPRPAAFDELLAGQDRLLVVTRPAAVDAIGALAIAGLPAAGAPCRMCAVGLGPVARALGAAGLAIPAALRRALDAPEAER